MDDQVRDLYRAIQRRELTREEALERIGELQGRVSVRGRRGPTTDIDQGSAPAVYRAEEPYLQDHTVHGDSVLIEVTHVSLAVDAVMDAFPAREIVGFSSFSFIEPVVVAPSRPVEVRVEHSAAGASVEVLYRQQGAATWGVCARGDLSQAAMPGDVPDIAALRESLPLRPHSDQLYTRNPHVAWGASFKTVTAVHLGPDQVLVKVDLTAGGAADGRCAYRFDPQISNSVLLAVFPLLEQAGVENIYMPLGIKQLWVRPTEGLESCWIVARLDRNSGELVTFDAEVVDDRNVLVARYSGYALKKMRPVQPASSATTVGADRGLVQRIQKYLLGKLRPVLGDRVGPDTLSVNLMELGVESAQLIALTEQIAAEKGVELFATVFFEYPNIEELSQHFATAHAASFADPADRSAPAPTASPAGSTHGARQVVPAVAMSPERPVGADDPIAIIGMDGRLAQSPDLQTFWDHLYHGRDLVSEVPESRWPHTQWFDADRDATHKTYSKWGSFLEGVDLFDPMFFGISPVAATWLDPQVRLLMEVVYGAAEDAGYGGTVKGSRTGLFTGVCFQEYWDEIIRTGVPMTGLEHASSYRSSASGQVSFALDLQGPSIPLDNACASSLTALHLACQSLRAGECAMAFATGINLLLSPLQYVYFSRIGAMSPTGRCHTFDERADGFVPGEGILALLLKPLRQAERDGDNIHAVIKGSALNHVGRSSNATAPRPELQTEVLLQAWRNAGIGAESLSYLECHGTGTQLGDPIEVAALRKAFEAHTSKTGFCVLGSAKAHIGHLEGAAGLAGVVKTVLSMKHRTIPRMPTFTSPNRILQLEASPFVINTEVTEWQAGPTPRRAGVSSFGMTGNNAHVVLEEYVPLAVEPDRVVLANDPAVIVLSARTDERLRVQIERLASALETPALASVCLADIAFTLQLGREAMDVRLALVCHDVAQLAQMLGRVLDGEEEIDGLYRGRASAHRDALGELLLDADVQQAVTRWLHKRKYGQLAAMWVKGLTVDWQALYPDGQPRRVSLPTYPFLRQRYWGLGEPGRSAADAPPAVRRPESAERLIFLPRWQAVAPTADPVVPASQTVLVVYTAGAAKLARSIAAHERNQKRGRVVQLELGRKHRQRSRNCYSCDGADPRAFEACTDGTGPIDRVYFVTGCENQARRTVRGSELTLLRLTQHLQRSGQIPGQLDFFLITQDTVRVDDGAVDPWAAGLTGMGFSLAQGDHRFRVRNLDVSSEDLDAPQQRAELVERILAQPASDRGELVKLQHDRMYRRHFQPRTSDGSAGPGLKQGGVYVIAGGSGLVGRIVTRLLMQAYRAQVVWIGRSAADDPDVVARQAAFEQWGTPPGYVQADVTCPEQMARATSLIRERFGAPDGAIFSAVVFRFGQSLADTTESEFEEIFGVKALGSRVFYEAFSKDPLDFMCFFSSAQGFSFSGAATLCAYAAGITAADSFVLGLQGQSGFPVGIVNWGFWRAFLEDTELGQSVRGNVHIGALEDHEGFACFEQFVSGLVSGETHQAVCLRATPPVLGLMRCQPGQRETVEAPVAQRPLGGRSGEAMAAGPAPRPVLSESQLAAWVRGELTGCLADAIGAAPEEVQGERSFADYGVDSITGAALVNMTNEKLGLSLNSAVIYEHASVQRLSAYILASHRDALSGSAASTAGQAPGRPGPLPPAREQAHRPDGAGEIAVIGLSGQFPAASDPQRFWDNLLAGHDAVAERGGRLADRDCFDPLFFNIAPREAESMTRHQRLILYESWKALEQAGVNPKSLAGSRVAVFIGAEPQTAASGSFTGTSDAIIASRLSYYLDLRGPALVVNTGCSSSGVALHLACESLRRGESSMALAGGVFADLSDATLERLAGIGMLSPSGRCHTFDAAADGTVICEGVGMVLLKPLSAAVADRDPIHGVIVASGVNQDGASNGITAPNGDAQEQLIVDTYREYAVDPERISYLEAHGTGTALGDPVEVNALTRAFGRFTQKRGFCTLGSAKAHIGHTSAAAGVLGLVKILLSMRHQQLPGLSHFQRLNPLIDLDNSPFQLTTNSVDWPADPHVPRMAALNSFGHSGTNAHLVVREYQAVPVDAGHDVVPDRTFLVPLSARGADRLRVSAGRLADHLRDAADAALLPSIAYTLQQGREAMKQRVVFAADSLAELRLRIDAFLAGKTGQGVWPGRVLSASAPVTAGLAADLLADWPSTAAVERIARAWVEGQFCDWSSLWPDAPQRVALPGYPFITESDGSGVTAPAEASEFAELMFLPRWEPEPAAAEPVAGPRRVLLVEFPSSLDVSAPIWGNHAAAGCTRMRIRIADSTVQLSPDTWHCGLHDPDGFETCLAGSETFDRVYFVSPLADAAAGSASSQEVALQCLRLVQCLQRHASSKSAIDFTVVTQDTVRMYDGQVNPVAAGLTGLCYAIAQGDHRVRLRNIDVTAEDIRRDADGALLEQILCEPPSGRGRQVKFRRGHRYRRVFLPLEVETGAAVSPFRRRGVYVIVGGSGTVGGVVSRFLISQHQARVVWIGRRPADDPAVVRKIEDLASLGQPPVYIQADVTDSGQLHDAVDQVKARYGQIHGAIFSGLVFDFDQPVDRTSEAAFGGVFAVKATGSLRFYEAFEQEELDFLCYFSSAQAFSFSGAANFSAYAAGITAADSLCAALRGSARFPLGLINWGFWGSSPANSRLGDNIEQLSDREGFACFEQFIRLLRARVLDQLVCMRVPQAVRRLMSSAVPEKATLVGRHTPSLVSTLWGPSSGLLPNRVEDCPSVPGSQQ